MSFEQIGGVPGGISYHRRPGTEDPDNLDPEEIARIMGPAEIEIGEEELDPDFADPEFSGFDQEENLDASIYSHFKEEDLI